MVEHWLFHATMVINNGYKQWLQTMVINNGYKQWFSYDMGQCIPCVARRRMRLSHAIKDSDNGLYIVYTVYTTYVQ